MATNRKLIDAPPERVFEVLSDPDNYGFWVVGSSDIRDADAGFPARGSRFHHTQGVLGIGIKDSTRVLECDGARGGHGPARARARYERVERDARGAEGEVV